MRTRLGTYRDGGWSLDVNGNGVWDGCSTDRCLTFGGPGDIPLSGDWSGDGVVSIGVFRPSENAFLLDWNHNGLWDGHGQAFDRKFSNFVAAHANNRPIAGKWSVNANDTIGMYRDGQWWLDQNGDGAFGGPDLTGTFGSAGELPIVGPWNNQSTDALGVFRPNGNLWFLDLSADRLWSSCPPDKCSSPFGIATDRPVAGIWRDGFGASIGMYRDGLWLLDGNRNSAWDACTTDDCATSFGAAGDLPVVGEWAPIQWGRGPDVNLGNYGSEMWENTSEVVASHPSCPQGRVVMAFGQTPTSVMRTNLSCVEGGGCGAQPLTATNGPIPTGGHTDNQTLRMGNGDLFHFRLGPQDAAPPALPKRSVGAKIFKSSDCGANWSLWSTIDVTSPAIANGTCSYFNGAASAAVYDPAERKLTIDKNNDFLVGADDVVVNLTAAGTNFNIATGDVIVAGNWNQVGYDQNGPTTSLGRFRNGNWLLDLNRNFNDDGCVSDKCAAFGTVGDIPVVGRFMSKGDNDVRSQIGVFRPSTGQWILDSNGNFKEDIDDNRFVFGQAGDIPVVGAWTNTGLTGQLMRVGVFRPSTNSWFLDDGPVGWNGCGTDKCYAGTFGDASQTPIAGVWQAAPNFRDGIGTFANGGWNRDLNTNGVWDGGAEGIGQFGKAGDVPLPGFWNVIFGGFDRLEAHFDRFKGVMYASMSCNGRDQKGMLAYSNDLGQTWQSKVVSPRGIPMMMTSTQNRTYLFSVIGSDPILWPVTATNLLGTPFNVTIGTPWYVYQNAPGATASNPPAGAATRVDRSRYLSSELLGGRAWDGAAAISTVGRSGNTDELLATYPSVVEGPSRQVTRMMRITVSGAGAPFTVTTSKVGILQGALYANPERFAHVTQSTLVPGDDGSEYSLVYWKEVDLGLANLTTVRMRGAVLRVPFGGPAQMSLLDLSLDSAGKSRSWQGYTITGDYQKGASFAGPGGVTKFLAHWVETPTGADRQLHAQIVTVHP